MSPGLSLANVSTIWQTRAFSVLDNLGGPAQTCVLLAGRIRLRIFAESLKATLERMVLMDQDVIILPQCTPAAATQGMAAVGCQQVFACACKSLPSLNMLEISILSSTSCSTSDQELAFSPARSYCTKVNPSLLDTRRTNFSIGSLRVHLLVLISVALRFWPRSIVQARPGWDDGFVVAGLIFALGVNALMPAGLHLGESRHQFVVDQRNFEGNSKQEPADLWMITCSNVFVRLSVLTLLTCFYHLYVFFIFIELLSVLLYTLVCHLVKYVWNTGIKDGYCWNKTITL